MFRAKSAACVIASNVSARTANLQPQYRSRAAARLERLPYSRYHCIVFVIIAAAFFLDSVDPGTMTFLLGSIKAEFGPSGRTVGLVASASFFGMMLGAAGAAGAGLLADRLGRRPEF